MSTSAKAITRFFYATIPGLAPARFALKDITASYVTKTEYRGLTLLPLNEALIIDVGANRGQSIAAFKKFVPNSKIVAFEPEPRLEKRLTARYRSDFSVSIQGFALSAQTGVSMLYIPHYGRWDCDGMAATDFHSATDWLNNPGRMYRFDARKLSVKESPIQCRTLDSFELSPQLVKLHAQGAELDILRGAIKTLRQFHPAVMCAFPSPAVTEFLGNLQYHPYVYQAGHFIAGVAKPSVTFTWYLTDDLKAASSSAL